MDQFVYPPCPPAALPKGIAAFPAALEGLQRGGWKGKGHLDLLFAFGSFVPDGSSG